MSGTQLSYLVGWLLMINGSWHFFNTRILTRARQTLLLYTSQSAMQLKSMKIIGFFFLDQSRNEKESQTQNHYRLSVTNVPVNFLHRLNAVSRRSGSSFKNFSSRTTFSISFDSTFRNAF